MPSFASSAWHPTSASHRASKGAGAYPITHTMDKSQHCSPNVFFQGKPAYLHNESYVDKVMGDEPGAGKGVVSQTNTTISHAIGKSGSVFVNGKPIVRTGDSVWMNWKAP
jgi:uncharacterized Zn-binding protein involved in type VI secretion